MDKQAIWNDITTIQEDLINMCCDMIKIPSENPPGNVESIITYITDYMDKCGIEYEVIRATPECPNIIARYGNPNGKRLVFNGHCDVVPAGDLSKWNFPPYCGEVRNGKILGRGTSDMKCGLGASLFAMGYYASHKIPLNGEIILTVVPDEESGGFYGTQWLFEHGYIKGDWAVVAEPTGYDNIEIGQRGSMKTIVTVKGTPAHGSLAPYVGDSAIEKLMEILPKFKKLRELHGELDEEMAKVMEVSKQQLRACHDVEGIENSMDHVSVNFGVIEGGLKSNVIADSAKAELDIRIPLGMTGDIVKEKIAEIIKESGLKEIEVTYMGADRGNYVSTEDPICKSVAANAKKLLGIDLIMAYQWASSDARYFRENGISTIQYGPSDSVGIHGYNETVSVSNVISSAKMYAGLIADLVG